MAAKKTTGATSPPAAKTAAAKQSAAPKKATSKSVASTEKPATKKPAASKSAAPTEKPAASISSAAAKKPAASKSAAPTEKPAASKSSAAAKKPAASKSAAPTEKPAASKKATSKTAAPTEKPAASKSAAAKKSAAKTTASERTPVRQARAKTEAAASKESGASAARARKPPAFSIGDKVVHPQHGAAIITRKTKQEVAGVKQDYFVLEIATDQLTVFVPVASIEETIRPVISQGQARRVFSLFREPPQEAGSNWSRWYKVLNEKMTSGDIYQVAEVVRDLSYAQQTKGISPALKRMLSKARLTLISELRFALNVDEEEATRKLDRALPKVQSPEPA